MAQLSELGLSRTQQRNWKLSGASMCCCGLALQQLEAETALKSVQSPTRIFNCFNESLWGGAFGCRTNQLRSPAGGASGRGAHLGVRCGRSSAETGAFGVKMRVKVQGIWKKE